MKLLLLSGLLLCLFAPFILWSRLRHRDGRLGRVGGFFVRHRSEVDETLPWVSLSPVDNKTNRGAYDALMDRLERVSDVTSEDGGNYSKATFKDKETGQLWTWEEEERGIGNIVAHLTPVTGQSKTRHSN